MNSPREDLFQPSLSDDDPPAAAPYSVGATFLTGFFGGPFAAIAILITNSVRLRRVSRDVPVWIAMLVLTCAMSWVLQKTTLGADARAWLDEQLGNRSLRLVYQLLALLIVAAGYALHRQEQRNTDLLGRKRPNGWIAGLACIVVGVIASYAYLTVLSGV